MLEGRPENRFHFAAKLAYFDLLVKNPALNQVVVPEEGPSAQDLAIRTLHQVAAARILFQLTGNDTKLADYLEAVKLFENNDAVNKFSSVNSYVNAVATENSIHQPTHRSEAFDAIEVDLVEQVVSKGKLPTDILSRLTSSPQEFPDVLRKVFMHQYLSFQGTKVIPDDKTSFWYFNCFNPAGNEALGEGAYRNPFAYFSQIPPVDVESLQTRNKILVTGTNVELQEMEFVKSDEIEHSVRIASFWERFFGNERFLDDPVISKPTRLVTTGFMRSYTSFGGETVWAGNYLEEHAKHFGVKLTYIPDNHP